MLPIRTAPTIEDISELAEQVLETLPEHLAAMVEGVGIQVVDFPDEETEREMGLDSPFDLLGLYVGTPFGDKSVSLTPNHVDIILLYRRPILDYWCDSGENLIDVVRNVLIHEIGHHFGFSDAQMAAIEADALDRNYVTA
jgi:predicted Zn-dependent protease with MMP-like domain